MSGLLREIREDLSFVRSHTLQPGWYKVLKIFLLLGFLAAYGALAGPKSAAIFLGLFFSLSLGVHLLYRARTAKWTRSWLDFVVVQEGDVSRPKRIGAFYYSFVLFNALLSLSLSLALA